MTKASLQKSVWQALELLVENSAVNKPKLHKKRTESQPCCSTCSDVFDLSTRRPRVLRCGHTFCTLCLEQVFATNAQCGTCEQPIAESNVSQLPTNHIVLDLYMPAKRTKIKTRPPKFAPLDQFSDMFAEILYRASAQDRLAGRPHMAISKLLEISKFMQMRPGSDPLADRQRSTLAQLGFCFADMALAQSAVCCLTIASDMNPPREQRLAVLVHLVAQLARHNSIEEAASYLLQVDALSSQLRELGELNQWQCSQVDFARGVLHAKQSDFKNGQTCLRRAIEQTRESLGAEVCLWSLLRVYAWWSKEDVDPFDYRNLENEDWQYVITAINGLIKRFDPVDIVCPESIGSCPELCEVTFLLAQLCANTGHEVEARILATRALAARHCFESELAKTDYSQLAAFKLNLDLTCQPEWVCTCREIIVQLDQGSSFHGAPALIPNLIPNEFVHVLGLAGENNNLRIC